MRAAASQLRNAGAFSGRDPLYDVPLMNDMAFSMPGDNGRGKDKDGFFVFTKDYSCFKASRVGKFWLDVSFRKDEYSPPKGKVRRSSCHHHSIRTCRYDVFTAVRMGRREAEAYGREIDRLNSVVADFGTAFSSIRAESGKDAFSPLKAKVSELLSSMRNVSAESKVQAMDALRESQGPLNRILRSKGGNTGAVRTLLQKLSEFQASFPAWREEEIRKFSAYNALREASFRQLRDTILEEELRGLSFRLSGPGGWGVRKFMMDDRAVIMDLEAIIVKIGPGSARTGRDGIIAMLTEAGKKVKPIPPRVELLKAYTSLKLRGKGRKDKKKWISAQVGSIDSRMRGGCQKEERDKLFRYRGFLENVNAGVERMKPASDYIGKAVHMLQVNKPWYWAGQLRETGDPYLMRQEKDGYGRTMNVVELIEAADRMLFAYDTIEPKTISRAAELYMRASELIKWK